MGELPRPDRAYGLVGLSIRQPWVALILGGQKTIEVRSWATKHRGVLWLHAGRRVEADVCRTWGFDEARVTRGALVGHCYLRACVEFTASTWEELRSAHLNAGSFEPRKFGWFLSDVHCIAPISMRGKLGLMKLPRSVLPRALTATQQLSEERLGVHAQKD